MEHTIIGIDCATQASRIGLALASWDGAFPKVEQVTVGGESEAVGETIVNWMPADKRVLLALDAPLGWPASLGEALAGHRAGEPVSTAPNELFRRLTDRVVRQKIGRLPLDVGADRIARTAHAALSLLDDVRRRTGHPLPLAWSPEDLYGLAAIEVYPAGTLTAYGVPASGYKRADQEPVRRTIIERLGQHLLLPEVGSLLASNSDALDAVVCALAGVDFLRGDSIRPADLEVARKEGWIWVRRPV